ncbi:MAG: metal ABC transporter permease [Nitrospira sp.]|nr:metal ABC transporter permease [Nitrospira sp.]MDH4245285.1 metal ABC transporter permease [Nitrospira sp.]MDH4357171.1 metal ABC transporter permease [Nitrospira sp.]MDH5320089.1 metal ABC transporter permease [Nitrospira sp.]
MLDLLAYDFMQRSLLAAAMVGGLCSIIGVFVVLRGLAFVGAGTSHAAFAGVALGYLLGWPPLLLAIVFGLATVWITGWMEEQGRMKLDVSIGILYTATMALGILFIGLMKSYNAEVYGYLFGSVLSVTPDELHIIGALGILVLGLIVVFSKELYFIAFDQEMAEASGVPARQIYFLLLTLVALTVVVSLKTVGAILVFAMILIPASTAYQLTHSLRTLTLYSAMIGISTSVAGVLISALWDIPSGPAIVLLATSIFFISVFFSPKRVKRTQMSHVH